MIRRNPESRKGRRRFAAGGRAGQETAGDEFLEEPEHREINKAHNVASQIPFCASAAGSATLFPSAPSWNS
jgi:hypothetical protein